MIRDSKQSDADKSDEVINAAHEEANSMIEKVSDDIEDLKSREQNVAVEHMDELVLGLSSRILGKEIK